ncbi:MAG: response regulator [Planctomycetaceae bacterium]|nr:response regulator [Planctomycetaceae bacterium]
MDNDSTIFIVDDDPAVRAGLTALVRSMRLHAEAYESAQAFLDALDSARSGCILVDVRMPGISGLDLLERLNQIDVPMPAIVMSAYGDVPMVVRAMKSGAMNFLEKPCRDQDLWEAIQEALKWDREHRQQLSIQAKVLHRLERLSEGEHAVLRLLIDGNSNKAIAQQLELSVRTIEVRRSKLMKKMRAESLAELIRLTLSANPTYGRADAETDIAAPRTI